MKSSVNKLIKSALFLAIAIVFQAIGRAYPQLGQFFTGSVVNAVLLIACAVCGTGWAVGVGCVTPILAGLIGQLPPPLLPFIPFIAIGNAIIILCYGATKNLDGIKSYVGILPGALLKYGFLALSAQKLAALFGIKLPKAVIGLMGMPQLITALIGGVIAFIILTALKKRKLV